MYSKVYSACLIWLNTFWVSVEVDVATWVPVFSIVWLWDTAIQESKERVRSSIKNSWYKFVSSRLTVNLSPADTKKKWPIYDLPIALWVLISTGQIQVNPEKLNKTLFVWELWLNGELKSVLWALPIAFFARENGFKEIIVPIWNANESALVEWISVIWVSTLSDVIAYLTLEKLVPPHVYIDDEKSEMNYIDLSHIKWQLWAKRALEIAVSWWHNVLLNWTPWSWKTVLARSIQSIMPDMTKEESLEVTKIYSVAWELKSSFIKVRPFRVVHHTASMIWISWGGPHLKPWEISLAHRWVLFLDEIAEFPTHVLEVLRQPMEDNEIKISRWSWTICYPAKFMLIASMNPCKCGYYNIPNASRACTCSSLMVSRYQKKISWPLLDRIDLFSDMSPIEYSDLNSKKEAEMSLSVKNRVQEARQRQLRRYKKDWIYTNSELWISHLLKYCKISDESDEFLSNASKQYWLSARQIHKVLKISRTIADLKWNDNISIDDVAEALNFRRKEVWWLL